MNTEKAIDLLDNLIGMVDDNQGSDYDAAFHMAIDALKAQAERTEERTETHACDLIDRQAAIDAVDSETVSTNPDHFKSSEKFIKFMDDADIASFGRWQWANGFNTALVATTIQLKKLPSAQSEIVRCEDCRHWEQETFNDGYCTEMDLRMCDADFYCGYAERRTDE